MQKCPGQDKRYWTPEDVTEVECGTCGHMLEFFKTEGTRRCPECRSRVVNPSVSMGCAQWCEYAKDCLGFDPKEAQAEQPEQDSLADRLMEKVQDEFGEDKKRIQHALRVLDHAEAILKHEDALPRVVIAAALLHDIGIHEAESKHGSAAAKYQEQEGPAVARRLLKDLAFDEETISAVCNIVAHHHSGMEDETTEFRIVWDADNIVNLAEEPGEYDGSELEERIRRLFKTESGKERALRIFGHDSAPSPDQKK